MCTVSVIPLPDAGGYRLVTNRDELRTRPPALPPRRHTPRPGVSAVWPVDPDAGGTWVATSDERLTLCTMNINPDPRPSPPDDTLRRSRGMIIPALIHAPDARGAVDQLGALDLRRFQCFRLIAVDPQRVIDGVWNQEELRVTERPMEPMCFATSGVGDHRVQARVALFRWWFGEGPVDAARQDAFHHHRWPERGEVSVHMARAEARTVSITSVEVRGEDDSIMIYRDAQRQEFTHRLGVGAESCRAAGV